MECGQNYIGRHSFGALLHPKILRDDLPARHPQDRSFLNLWWFKQHICFNYSNLVLNNKFAVFALNYGKSKLQHGKLQTLLYCVTGPILLNIILINGLNEYIEGFLIKFMNNTKMEGELKYEVTKLQSKKHFDKLKNQMKLTRQMFK